jgi:hypothetical protein
MLEDEADMERGGREAGEASRRGDVVLKLQNSFELDRAGSRRAAASRPQHWRVEASFVSSEARLGAVIHPPSPDTPEGVLI